ncbi:MAG: 3-isopropylmalate dehydrogenase [Lachnospiraceae bacterium]|nr:3-isopropylmalate dehydrogenase [Lachnospiraceae bacterium]
MGEEKEKRLQWHPAFFAGLQIELAEEVQYLHFENEHLLGSKPMQVDVLVIKKEPERRIQKNIGRIFRGHNILEYKGPGDSFGVDDFFKVYGYTCFYKSDTQRENEIRAKDISISLVCCHYPRELVRCLWQEQHRVVRQRENGIYDISDALFPIQLIVTGQLDPEENLWLRSLTNDLKNGEEARKLLLAYQKHRTEKLYQSVMDIIVRANKERFRVNDMCEALEEIMKDKLEERERQGISRGIAQGISQGRQQMLLALIKKKLEKGKSVPQIADELEESEDVILPLYNQLKAE